MFLTKNITDVLNTHIFIYFNVKFVCLIALLSNAIKIDLTYKNIVFIIVLFYFRGILCIKILRIS